MKAELQRFHGRTAEHRFYIQFGAPCWSYAIGGGKGVAVFNVREWAEDKFTVGLEFHSRSMPSGPDVAPSHLNCTYTGGPCWHDGTSLYAEEQLLPLWKVWRNDPLQMLDAIRSEYESRFNSGEEG